MVLRGLWITLLFVGLLQASAPAGARAAGFCQVGQAPEFTSGFALLKTQLGAIMGDPVECEHSQAANGDTLQATTTGLAYYRRALDTPIFTDGQMHYAWTTQGLVGWDGPSPDAPLMLTYAGNQATWCMWGPLGVRVNGFLCVYPTQTVGAWYQASDSSAWQLLGTEAGPDSPWVLTDVGRAVLGLAAGPPAPISPEPRATPSPVLLSPPDSDLDVRLDPIDPGVSGSFPMLTGRICNRSTGWTATDIHVDFAFYGADGLLATPDHGSTSAPSLTPDTCEPFLVSVGTLYPWQTVRIDRVTLSWRR